MDSKEAGLFGVVTVQAHCWRSAFVQDTSQIVRWPGWDDFGSALQRGSLLEPQMFQRMMLLVCLSGTAVFRLSYLMYWKKIFVPVIYILFIKGFSCIN